MLGLPSLDPLPLELANELEDELDLTTTLLIFDMSGDDVAARARASRCGLKRSTRIGFGPDTGKFNRFNSDFRSFTAKSRQDSNGE